MWRYICTGCPSGVTTHKFLFSFADCHYFIHFEKDLFLLLLYFFLSLSITLSICLAINLSFYAINLQIYLSVHLSICHSISQSINLSVNYQSILYPVAGIGLVNIYLFLFCFLSVFFFLFNIDPSLLLSFCLLFFIFIFQIDTFNRAKIVYKKLPMNGFKPWTSLLRIVFIVSMFNI